MEDFMVKVSVIVPVYNGSKYLRGCLDCLVNQTLKDIEIIQGETIPLDKVKQARKEIQKYEADCLVLEDRPICLECNENMFKSIYHILDKLIEESEN